LEYPIIKLEKPTMTRKRTYGDQCGVARALDILGERWALLVVRELLFGPKRFTDLRAGLPNLGPDVLSQRLRDLEGAGLLLRRVLDPPAAAQVYELTERGRELEPVLIELGRWGTSVPFPEDAVFGPDSMVLAMKTVFDPARAGDLAAGYELRLGSDRFAIEVHDGEIDLRRGALEEPELTLEVEVGVLAELLWRGRSLDASMAAGEIKLEGSKRSAARFLGLFPAPAPG
jgi:DNA-binding HxlR family transcriptional regulator